MACIEEDTKCHTRLLLCEGQKWKNVASEICVLICPAIASSTINNLIKQEGKNHYFKEKGQAIRYHVSCNESGGGQPIRLSLEEPLLG